MLLYSGLHSVTLNYYFIKCVIIELLIKKENMHCFCSRIIYSVTHSCYCMAHCQACQVNPCLFEVATHKQPTIGVAFQVCHKNCCIVCYSKQDKFHFFVQG